MIGYIVKFHGRNIAYLEKQEMPFPMTDHGLNDSRMCTLLGRWHEVKEIKHVKFNYTPDGIEIYFKNNS